MREIADDCGVSPAFISKHCKRFGIEAGDDGLYDSEQVKASMAEGRKMNKATPSAGKAELALRKTEAEARILEIKARILEKSVLDVEAVASAWVRIAAALRSEIMGIPSKVGQRGEMLPAAKLVQVCTEICNDTLRLIATQPTLTKQ